MIHPSIQSRGLGTRFKHYCIGIVILASMGVALPWLGTDQSPPSSQSSSPKTGKLQVSKHQSQPHRFSPDESMMQPQAAFTPPKKDAPDSTSSSGTRYSPTSSSAQH